MMMMTMMLDDDDDDDDSNDDVSSFNTEKMRLTREWNKDANSKTLITTMMLI
jgi:hypothetical protein